MRLDIFTHFLPPAFAERVRESDSPLAAPMRKRVAAIPHIADIDERLRVVASFDDYAQILSLASPPIEALAHPPAARALARLANDGLAELVDRHGDAFPAFVAGVPAHDVDATLEEIDRAIGELGAVGIQLYTNVNGRPLDDPGFEPVLARMAELGKPVWLHPARTAAWPDYPGEDRSRYEIWWLFGWPYETSVCMSRLVFSGVLERHPGLQVIAHHGGAMVPFFAGRVGPGMDQMGARTEQQDREALLGGSLELPGRPIDAFRRFHADTALFGNRGGLACAVDFFGADRLLFASDCPFEPEPGAYIRATIDDVDGLDLSEADRRKVYEANARALLGLGDGGAPPPGGGPRTVSPARSGAAAR
jgi:predicted TIM-barrel fold metal-dependent hydrolase